MGLFTGGAGAVRVHSVYEDTTLATTNASTFTVPGIPWQGTVLLRLSSVQQGSTGGTEPGTERH